MDNPALQPELLQPDFKKHYTSLDRERSEIRLFSFEKEGDDILKFSGELHVYPISACPPYTALSYTWGRPRPQRFMTINQDMFPIRNNLYQALLALFRRQQWPKQAYWIDSICINQADVLERNHQVGLMQSIFSNAGLVIAWLGPGGQEELKIPPPPNPRIPDSYLSPENKDFYKILEPLNYWRRLWVVQELILAEEILVGVGDQFFSWDRLKSGAESFMKHRNDEIAEWTRFVPRVGLGRSNIQTEDAPEWVKLVRERNEYIFGLREKNRLGSLILQFGRNECTEPRDKVIGLLGLVSDDVRHLADYSMPMQDFFRAVCRYVFASPEFRAHGPRMQFQCYLGGNLGLPSSVFRQKIEP